MDDPLEERHHTLASTHSIDSPSTVMVSLLGQVEEGRNPAAIALPLLLTSSLFNLLIVLPLAHTGFR